MKLDTAHVIGECWMFAKCYIFPSSCKCYLLFLIIIVVLFNDSLLRCHVMEVESFENQEVAKMLNDWFVSIKVSYI